MQNVASSSVKAKHQTKPTDPPSVRTTVVQIKYEWSENWQTWWDLEPMQCELMANSVGRSSLTLRRRYGVMYDAGETPSFATREKYDLRGAWVRVIMPPDGWDESPTSDRDPPGPVIFVGQILRVDTIPFGVASADDIESGNQIYHAVGAERQLEQTKIWESEWNNAGTVVRLGWCPGFNSYGPWGYVRGNRSATKKYSTRAAGQRCYQFSGRQTDAAGIWTAYDIVEHLLETHINATDQPIWKLGGQIEILQQMQLVIEMPRGARNVSVRDIIDQAISPSYGVDYVIVPTDDGFEICVFGLISESSSFALAGGGVYDIVRNPRTWDFVFDNSVDFDVTYEGCDAQLYDKIVVVGARIQVCFSAGADSDSIAADLEPAWSSTDESAYETAVSASLADAEKNDAYRGSPRFRDVFRSYRVVPGSWSGLPIECGLDGTLSTGGDYQDSVRRTLPRLPLLEQFDYTTNPPTFNGASGYQDSVDWRESFGFVTDPETSTHVDITALGEVKKPSGNIKALDTEWGIWLGFQHAHAIARNHWTGNPSRLVPGQPPEYGVDYDTLGATIAIEMDHRVQLGADLPDSEASGLNRTMVIEVPDAQLWVLAASTVVGIASDGSLQKSPASAVLLRDDRDVLARVMAGAIARYLLERSRTTIKARRILPYNDWLGCILEGIAQGDAGVQISAPVTAVKFDFTQGISTLSVGQAIQ